MAALSPRFPSPAAAFAAAAARIGQTKLGKLVGRTQGAVSKRLKAGDAIWAENLIEVEAATGISRHDLRPDLYPREDAIPARQPAGQPPAGISPAPAGGSPRPALDGVRP